MNKALSRLIDLISIIVITTACLLSMVILDASQAVAKQNAKQQGVYSN